MAAGGSAGPTRTWFEVLKMVLELENIELNRLKYALSSGDMPFIATWLSRYECLLLDSEVFTSLVIESPEARLSSAQQRRGSGSSDFWLSVSSSVLASIGQLSSSIKNEANEMTFADSEDDDEVSVGIRQDPKSLSTCLEILTRLLLLCSKSLYVQSKSLQRDILDLIKGSDLQHILVEMIPNAEPVDAALIFAVLSASMDTAERQKLFTHSNILKAAGIAAVLIAGAVLLTETRKIVLFFWPAPKHIRTGSALGETHPMPFSCAKPNKDQRI
jgi:hypothetical protein